jgi:dienelactone hydrolase
MMRKARRIAIVVLFVVIALLVVVLPGCMSHHACVHAPDTAAELKPVDYKANDRFKVYRIGDDGPPVILLHELPGMSPEDLRLARLLAGEHFTVYLPLFFGDAGKANMTRNPIAVFTHGDFHLFAHHEAAPAVEWVRNFGAWVSAQHHGSKVGVIGMCLTGNFPVPLAREQWFGAGVMSQPAMPLLSSALGVSDEDIAKVPADAKLVYLRFSDDRMSPPGRLAAFREKVKLDVPQIGVGCRKHAHSVLAEDFIDEKDNDTRKAFDYVVAVFHEQLKGGNGQ